MEKNIRDYLHLYFGCEILWELADGSCGGVHELTDLDFDEFYKSNMNFKLLLRPISDIQNTEAFEIYKMYFGKETADDWSGDTGSVYFNPKQVRVKAENALRIFNGDDWEQGDFMKVVSMVPYLLKQSFDLFGLIEAGLAIDKTTTHHK